ncbi:MAG: hypothetical protein KY429_11135 [Actinobacteria bacterium]|nr:hypothetical protein [Actinomycetota bacterium]
MEVRFYADPATGEPHIHGHGVSEAEEREVSSPLEDGPGAEGARVAIGQTESGRYLRIIYVPDVGGDSVFVITAHQLGPKALKSLRRRLRRRQ